MRRAALTAEGIRTTAAVIGFLLLARALPLEDLGRLVVLTAAVSLATPWLTLGLPMGLTRHASRGTLPVAPGDAVRSLTMYSLVVGVPPLLLVPLVLGGDIRTALPLLAAEVAVVVTTSSAQAVSLAQGRARRLVLESASLSLPRVVAPVLVLLGPSPSLGTYASIYGILGGGGALLVLLSRRRGTRVGLLSPGALLGVRYQQGAMLLSNICSKVIDDVDKPALQALTGAATAALYAVPYRLVGFVLVPVRALLAAEVPGWHREDAAPDQLRRSLSQVTGRCVALVVLAGLGLWTGWPLMLALVGDQYTAGRQLVPLLTLACLARAVHYCCGEMLVALGRARWRAGVQVGAAVLNIVSLILLVPGRGAFGAGLATLVTELALAIVLGASVVRHLRSGRPTRRATVYDPDNLNPYGREVAALLHHEDVRLVGTTEHTWAPDGVRLVPSMRLRPGASRTQAAISQSLTLLHLVGSVVGGGVLVVAWTRTAADGMVLGILARVTRRVYTVVHNPVPRQQTTVVRRLADNWLLTGSTCVFHSEALRAAANSGAWRAVVIDHPPYAQLVHRYGRTSSATVLGRVAVLGQLRSDKSPGDIAAVLRQLPRQRGLSVRFTGKGTLTSELVEAAEGLDLIDSMRPRGVGEEEMVDAVREASVVLAPYRGATQSGSVVLAVTFGVPVVAYDAGAMREHVPPGRLVPVGDSKAMALVAGDVLLYPPIARSEPARNSPGEVAAWRDRVSDAWAEMLDP